MLTRSMANKSVNNPVIPVPAEDSESVVPTLDVSEEELWSNLSAFTPQTDTEKLLVGCISSLLTKIKNMSSKMDVLSGFVDANCLMAAKAEQYSRRDTLLVSGVSLPNNEKIEDLVNTVAGELSKSGTTVSANDFQPYIGMVNTLRLLLERAITKSYRSLRQSPLNLKI